MPRKKESRPQAGTIEPYQNSDRVALQARVRAQRRRAGEPMYRPLRIYTLDPSVSDRLGGVATVQVPYEKLAPGPVGALFEILCEGAPRELAASVLDLDSAHLLMSSGLSPTPA